MISLDWQERLKMDTQDFIERKLPKGNYDIDIVYNAYPQRIDGNIPHAVITLVGKTIAAKIYKYADKYFDFYDYLLKKKGEHGGMIFAYIMARAIKKQPVLFLNYIEDFFFNTHDQKTCNLVMDKVIYPLLKKDTLEHIDLIINWVKKDNKLLEESITKLLNKLIGQDTELIAPIFQKLETSWLYATPNIIKVNSKFLKAVYKKDKELYLSVYHNYQTTRNPIFAEILCEAICCYDDNIQTICDTWSHSGNIKVKKIGLHGQKLLKSRKGKK
ncbi:MAG: hypothetical protein P9M11_09530 [Candidatus Tenebribacter burtonii]|nr:hypothetical protein [Candidatus Tenebribacter burtonii]